MNWSAARPFQCALYEFFILKNVSLLFFIVQYRKGDGVDLAEPVLISTLAFPELYSPTLK